MLRNHANTPTAPAPTRAAAAVPIAPHGTGGNPPRPSGLASSRFHDASKSATACAVVVRRLQALFMFEPKSASNFGFAGESVTRADGIGSRYARSELGFFAGLMNASLSAAARFDWDREPEPRLRLLPVDVREPAHQLPRRPCSGTGSRMSMTP
jgi:hypothetical protein